MIYSLHPTVLDLSMIWTLATTSLFSLGRLKQDYMDVILVVSLS